MIPARVLVTGARGKTGREVVRQLAETGVAVQAGSRSPRGLRESVQSMQSVRPVPFDWKDPGTWEQAVAGVDAIYLMRPDLPTAPELVHDLVQHAPDAHVVLLSEQGAGSLSDASWERRVEIAVSDAAATWTVLRPSWFHQVMDDPRFYLSAIRDEGILPISSGGSDIAFVDARDIAAVAVVALLDRERTAGWEVPVTGPEALTVADAAAVISAASGRPVRAVDMPRQEASAGLEPWLAEIYGGVIDRVRDGVFGEVGDDVSRLTGRAPRSLAAFASERAEAWQRLSA